MVATTSTVFEVSRFHEMILGLCLDGDQPAIAVQSSDGEWKADIHIIDSAVIAGELEPLDRLSTEEWLSLHRDDLLEAWERFAEGHDPESVEALPDDWPIGGPSPTRAISVKPLEEYRLRIEWEDGSVGELDLAYLADHPAFAAWRDRAVFESVRIVGSYFTWGEEMEICAWLDCWPTLRKSPQKEPDGTDR